MDRYGGYNRLGWRIQYCYAHLLRDVQDLETEFQEDTEVVAFVNTMSPLLTEACHLCGQSITDSEYYRRAREIQGEIEKAVNRAPFIRESSISKTFSANIEIGCFIGPRIDACLLKTILPNGS